MTSNKLFCFLQDFSGHSDLYNSETNDILSLTVPGLEAALLSLRNTAKWKLCNAWFFELFDFAELLDMINASVKVSEDVCGVLPQLMQYCLPSSLGILSICDLLRRRQLPQFLHSTLLQQLRSSLESRHPPSILFPGNRQSFLQFTVSNLVCPYAYTVNIWLYLEPCKVTVQTKPITLFQCRSPMGGIACTILPLKDVQTNDKSKNSDGRAARKQNFRIIFQTMSMIDDGAPDVTETSSITSLPIGVWTHLAFVHREPQTDSSSSSSIRPTMTMWLDGRKYCSIGSKYPFSSIVPESLWVVGQGFDGRIANLSLTPEELTSAAIAWLSAAGPSGPAFVNNCCANPLYSSKTGVKTMSSLWTIEDEEVVPRVRRSSTGASVNSVTTSATKTTQPDDIIVLSKNNRYEMPIFCITALHFKDGINCTQPIDAAGVKHGELLVSGGGRTQGSTSDAFSNASNEEQGVVAALKGQCRMVSENCSEEWLQSWVAAGGCLSMFYLLFDACENVNTATDTAGTVGIAEGEPSDAAAVSNQNCLLILDLLSAMLKSSMQIKDQFIQLHGYHLIALALHATASVTGFEDHPKPYSSSSLYQNGRGSGGCNGFSCELVDKCFQLCNVMGLDDNASGVGSFSKEGGSDIAAAACQGLLFNFQLVWGYASIAVKEHLLAKFCALSLNSSAYNSEQVEGENLLKYVGVQQFLDVLKLYIPSSTSSKAPDLCIRLITVAINASIYKQMESTHLDALYVTDASMQQFPEIEMLLYSLEESMDSYLVEYLLRVLCSLQFSAPSCLLPVLLKHRFVETTPLTLLTQTNLSLQVRRMTLLLLLWLLAWEFEQPLDRVLLKMAHDNAMDKKKKKAIVSETNATPTPTSVNRSKTPVSFIDDSTDASDTITNETLKKFSATLKLRSVDASPLPKMGSAFAKRLMSDDEQSRLQQENADLFKPFEASWVIICRIAKSFTDTPWVNIISSLKQNVDSSSFKAGQEFDCLCDIFSPNGPLGSDSLWLSLPVLSCVAPYFSLVALQRTLMSLRVTLMTQEVQTVILASLQDVSWVQVMVKIVISCIEKQLSIEGKISKIQMQLGLLHKNVMLLQDLSNLQDELNMAETCVEITLDTLISVMEKKLHCHTFVKTDIDTSCHVWRLLFRAIKILSEQLVDRVGDTDGVMVGAPKDPSHSSINAAGKPMFFLVQCVWSHCARSGSTVSAHPTHAPHPPDRCPVRTVITKGCIALYFHRLSRSTAIWTPLALKSVAELLGYVEERQYCYTFVRSTEKSNKTVIEPSALESSVTTHHEEEQLLLNMIAMMGNLRRCADGGALNGKEWLPMRIAMRIIVFSLPRASENTVDMICAELYAILKYLCQPWGPNNLKGLKEFLMSLFDEVEMELTNSNITERDRYTSLIFSIIGYFSDLSLVHSEKTPGLPAALVPILAAFHGVEKCNSILWTIEFMKKSLREVRDVKSKLETQSSLTSLQRFASEEPLDDSSEDIVLGVDDPIGHALQDQSISEDEGESSWDVDEEEVEEVVVAEEKSFIADEADPTPETTVKTRTTSEELIVAQLNEDEDDLMKKLARIAACNGDVAGLLHNHQSDLVIKPAGTAALASSARKKMAEIAANNKQVFDSFSPSKQRQKTPSPFSDKKPAPMTKSTSAKAYKETSIKVNLSRSLSAPSSPVTPIAMSVPTPIKPAIIKDLKLEVVGEKAGTTDLPKKETPRPTAVITVKRTHDQWLSARRSIQYKRIDLEQTRLAQSIGATNSSHIALDRFWINTQHRFEHEYMCNCGPIWEWKLGVAHEGLFPHRHRVVLRRQFNKSKQRRIDVSGGGMGTMDSSFGPGSQVPNTHPEYSMGARNRVLMEEENHWVSSLQQSYRIETGPNHTGAPRLVMVGQQLNEVNQKGEVVMNPQNIIQQANVFLITPSGKYSGVLVFSSMELWYYSLHSIEEFEKSLNDHGAVSVAKNCKKKRCWSIATISEVHLRRYRLRDTALEIFFSSGKHRSVMVDFGHTKEDEIYRNSFAQALMGVCHLKTFVQWPGDRLLVGDGPVCRKVQEQWLSGEISNYDYLMALNTLSGRTFNDLCQYPVMPWIISQYSESSIDLQSPGSYRDLSKPMGAQTDTNLAECLERYQQLKDNSSKETSDIPAFMYGSHYSTMVGVVLYYFVRLQPFAALHRAMQNDHFDVPDRLFSSIEQTFRHNTTTLSDVKELTPEWFTLPDFLRNKNGYNLGETQFGQKVGDVTLPKWAKTPEDFISINRAALESDYVSAHLHEWIDLIFGYKQTGDAAVKANNVFYYLTYFGAIDRSLLSEAMRKSVELQIGHFGSHPMQLFSNAHPAKRLNCKCPRPLKYSLPLPVQLHSATFNNKFDFRLLNGESVEEFLAVDSSTVLIANSRNSHVVGSEVIGMMVCLHYVVYVLASGKYELYAHDLSVSAAMVISNMNNKSFTNADFPAIAMTFKHRHNRYLSKIQDKVTVDGEAGTSKAGRHRPVETEEGGLLIISPELMQCAEPDARIPLALPNLKSPQKAPEVLMDKAALLTMLHTTASKHMLTYGFSDGRVIVHQFSEKLGYVKTTTEFRCHQCKVICVQSDSIPSSNLRQDNYVAKGSGPSGMDAEQSTKDMIVSLDVSGRLFVWEMAYVKTAEQGVSSSGFSALQMRTVVPCAPLYVFQSHVPAGQHISPLIPISSNKEPSIHGAKDEAPASPGAGAAFCEMQCDVSWHLGVAVTSDGISTISVYSLERQEKLHSFDVYLDGPVGSKAESNVSHCYPENFVQERGDSDSSKTGELLPSDEAMPMPHRRLWRRQNTDASLKCTIHQIFLCEMGKIVVSMICSEGEGTNSNTSYVIATYTISGVLSDVLHHGSLSVAPTEFGLLPSKPTYVNCLHNLDIILIGLFDGTVVLGSVNNLSVYYCFRPHMHCQLSNIDASGENVGYMNASRGYTAPTSTSTESNGSISQGGMGDAISHIEFGPDQCNPLLLAIATVSGHRYLHAFPDYIDGIKGRGECECRVQEDAIEEPTGTIQDVLTFADETFDKVTNNSVTRIFSSMFDSAFGSDSHSSVDGDTNK